MSITEARCFAETAVGIKARDVEVFSSRVGTRTRVMILDVARMEFLVSEFDEITGQMRMFTESGEIGAPECN